MGKVREYPVQRTGCVKYTRGTELIVTGMRCRICDTMQPSTNFRVGGFRKDGTPVQHFGCMNCTRSLRAWRMFVNALETATGISYTKILEQRGHPA